MSESPERTGYFWEVVAGRDVPPPAARTLGWSLLSVAPERGEIEVGFTATEQFLNPWGSVHGGFLAAMLDDTLGPAITATLGPDDVPLTLELKVNYLRRGRPGRIVGRGRVVHRATSIAFLAGELVDEDGEVIATATATARILRAVDRTRRPDNGAGAIGARDGGPGGA